MGQPGCNDVTPQRSTSYGGPSKGSSVKDSAGTEKPDTRIDSPKALHIECGVKAIKSFLGNDFATSILKTEFKQLKKKSLTGGLNCKDLSGLLVDQGFAPDCRYCSQVRTYNGFPLPSFVDGLIALKFKNRKESHWVAWKDGRVVINKFTSLSEVSDLYDYFISFDGFGHRVALWDTKRREQQNDMAVIRATHSVRCQGNCAGCFRETACVDSTSSRETGFNFTCTLQ